MCSLLGDRTAATTGTAPVLCRPAQSTRSEPARAKACQPSVSGSGCPFTSSLRVQWDRNGRPGSRAVKYRAPVSSGDFSGDGYQATVDGLNEADGDDFYSVLGVVRRWERERNPVIPDIGSASPPHCCRLVLSGRTSVSTVHGYRRSPGPPFAVKPKDTTQWNSGESSIAE